MNEQKFLSIKHFVIYRISAIKKKKVRASVHVSSGNINTNDTFQDLKVRDGLVSRLSANR